MKSININEYNSTNELYTKNKKFFGLDSLHEAFYLQQF